MKHQGELITGVCVCLNSEMGLSGVDYRQTGFYNPM